MSPMIYDHYMYGREKELIQLDFPFSEKEWNRNLNGIINVSHRLHVDESHEDNHVIEVNIPLVENEIRILHDLERGVYERDFGLMMNFTEVRTLPRIMEPPRPRVVYDAGFLINYGVMRSFELFPKTLDRLVEYVPISGYVVDNVDFQGSYDSGCLTYNVRARLTPLRTCSQRRDFGWFDIIDRIIPAKHRERMGYIDGSNSQPYYLF